MNFGRRARRILREEGATSLLWRSVRYGWTSLVWRREFVQWLPVSLVAAAFGLRARLVPHASDANPAEPIRADPDEIEHYHGNDDPKRLGHVVDGDWDEPEGRFEETTVFRSLEARFVDGVDWAETPLYAEYRERLEAGDPYWRCTTPAELEAYFREIDDLYRTIDEHGYRSQRSLLSSDDAAPREENTDAVHPAVQEVGVNVYRDGTLVKKGAGFHRLAIAKLLDIEEIPVTVRVRHDEWQAIRDEVRAASSPEQLSDRARAHLDYPDLREVHPDLRDVVPAAWRSSAASDAGGKPADGTGHTVQTDDGAVADAGGTDGAGVANSGVDEAEVAAPAANDTDESTKPDDDDTDETTKPDDDDDETTKQDDDTDESPIRQR